MLADGWKKIAHVVGEGHYREIVAARDEGGVGVVARWVRDGGGPWALISWGCTEDHAGHDGEGDGPLPDAPPFDLGDSRGGA